MARIKAFEIPNISSFKNFKRKQKTASFSFVYFWLDFLFTGKQKKILKVLMAQIKVFWSFQHVLTLKKFSESEKKSKCSLFSFVYFFTNYLFTGKQMKILKFLVANMEAIEVPNNFSAQIFFLKPKSSQIWTCFLLFTFLEISCLQVNKRR